MDPRDLRIGDAEREHTMTALREHFAQGRLDHEELDQRLDQALTARTAGELARVTADLPGPGAAGPRLHPGPAVPGPDDWHAATEAQRAQMQSMGQAHRDLRREWRQWPHRSHHHHPGPGPFLPILFVIGIVGLIFGGWGLLKVVLFIWVGSMIVSAIRRRAHRRP
ncbi:DUF1707 SHOCT-like domain-containing protein [Nonomuraea cavernae]|uniref:DUF1707 domain-containing protein n=1 Tax=Nonomuraea cavernae TaxID=2045107 RepID=A0A918DL05_9ACTN|nr:DUF1707 domain-containing protein [Nonomuraea cavernae]MCA2187691.1 DUF1707 domain-containing protein [Nonomuraea cavernae]GGO70797.1 hypothetical protein GCM10012289_35030 [Nonomuraea cavernae]